MQRIVFILPLLLLISCGRVDETEIRKVDNFRFKGIDQGIASFEIDLIINNPSRHRIIIREIDTKLTVNNVYIGRLSNADPFLIPANSENLIRSSFNLRLANILTSAAMLYRLSQETEVEIGVDGHLLARVGLMHKKVVLKETRKISTSNIRL